MVSNFGIGVSDYIIDKFTDPKFEIIPWAGENGGGNDADGILHGVVDVSNIIIENNKELLTVLELSRS